MEILDANHAQIAQFLQHHVSTPLPAVPAGTVTANACVKAGVVPFIEQNGAYLFYVLRPVAARPQLNEPEFQLCKGTRMAYEQQAWVDLAEGASCSDNWEQLAATALREGQEELGLLLENITQLYDAGGFEITSASSGASKPVWFYAARLREQHKFLPIAEIAETTAERKWVTAEAFAAIGRTDHARILHNIAARLPKVS